jgi:hypothetical protein
VSANHPRKSILYFPNGIYETATLKVPSNVSIYLTSGAVILADPDINDYSPVAPNYADQTNVSALLLIRDVSNVKIYGHGVIDGGGHNMYDTYGLPVAFPGLERSTTSERGGVRPSSSRRTEPGTTTT